MTLKKHRFRFSLSLIYMGKSAPLVVRLDVFQFVLIILDELLGAGDVMRFASSPQRVLHVCRPGELEKQGTDANKH